MDKINVLSGIFLVFSWAIIDSFIFNPIFRLFGCFFLICGLYLIEKTRVMEVILDGKRKI